MKVMLCLLSDQVVPNLLSVHHFAPDRLVLVQTPDMRHKRIACNLLAALRKGNLDYDGRTDIVDLAGEDNLEAIRACLADAFGRFPSAQWIANVTGGTKPMSLGAYEFFKAIGARLIYVNASRPSEFLGLDGRPLETGTHSLSIAEFLAAYGFESSKAEAKLAEAESRAAALWPVARVIAEHAADKNLVQVSEQPQRRELRNKGIQLREGHCDHLPDIVRSALAEHLHLDRRGTGLHGKVNKYGGRFLTGEWLEIFFWNLLHRHADALGIQWVRLGVEARKAGGAPTEFDVAFMRQQSLCAIECKSGTQEHLDDPVAPLDKLEARIQQFRALRVKSWLATTTKKILNESGGLLPHFQDRARIYDCRVIALPDIQRLALHWDLPDVVRSVLFGNQPAKTTTT